MKALLSADLNENFFDNDVKALLEDIKGQLEIANVAAMTAGKGLAQLKAKLGRKFNKLLDAIGFGYSDANKLIKLYQYFDHADAMVLEVGPLTLFRLCAPSCKDAREKLYERLEDKETRVTQQEVEGIRIENKPATKPRPISKNNASMVGNQQGGTAIFRMEVKDAVLASECHDSFKLSGGTVDSWMRQLISSFGLVGELATTVMGKGISHISDIDELKITLSDKNLFAANNTEVTLPSSQDKQFSYIDSELPPAVQECVESLLQLDKQLASYDDSNATHAIMRQACLDDQRQIEEQLQSLCQEFGLNYRTFM